MKLRFSCDHILHFKRKVGLRVYPVRKSEYYFFNLYSNFFIRIQRVNFSRRLCPTATRTRGIPATAVFTGPANKSRLRYIKKNPLTFSTPPIASGQSPIESLKMFYAGQTNPGSCIGCSSSVTQQLRLCTSVEQQCSFGENVLRKKK